MIALILDRAAYINAWEKPFRMQKVHPGEFKSASWILKSASWIFVNILRQKLKIWQTQRFRIDIDMFIFLDNKNEIPLASKHSGGTLCKL